MPGNGSQEKGVFELGLVMAGAVSAGAYAAGVVDFLIDALEEWEAAKADDYAAERQADPTFEPPRHRVSVKALSGASAGSMCGALAALSFASEFEPCRDVDDPPPPDRNRLFDAWVEQVDLSHMLRADDLQDGKPLVSALDSTVLERILADALKVTPRARPPYVDPAMALFLSVTNLRGVPYGFRLAGGQQTYVHGMTAHKDYMTFQLEWGGPYRDDAIRLDPAKLGLTVDELDDKWWLFGRSALASGAFPIGLAPRKLERSRDHYDIREWMVPNDDALVDDGDNPRCECTHGQAQEPNWPDDMDGGAPYEFWCVDGGVMDNEPLELARCHLSHGGRNPRDPFESSRAVIMVDPFPNLAVVPPYREEDAAIEKTVPSMFNGLIRQARFKPDEMLLAQNGDVGSRFVVAPARTRPGTHDDPEYVEPAIASAILGAFGGFLARAFRAHDYALGRRNCQRFLSHHFVLPAENETLFQGWQGADQVTKRIDGKPVACQPIIPLFRRAREEAKPYRPVGRADFDPRRDDLRLSIKRRTKAVVGAAMQGRLNWAKRTAIKIFGIPVIQRTVLDKFDEAIEKGLEELDDSFAPPGATTGH